MKPLVSIIVPTRNEESVIASTLINLRKLTSVPYEIIVSDGMSTDRTVEIAREYADIVVPHNPEWKRTIAAGRNHGAEVATGEYYLFLDADVTIHDINNFMIHAVDYFKKDKKLVGLTSFLRVHPGQATIADRLVFAAQCGLYFFMNNVLQIGTSFGEFQMVPADVFKKINGYNENFVASEDYDLFSRLSKIGHTRMGWKLQIFHTGRRAHAIGWPKLLRLWVGNTIYNLIYRHSLSSEWEVIR
ncbi:MAG: glycosyltransferase [Patescibacteria group bacterium]